MYYVYILVSLINGTSYTGITGQLVEQRLNEHNLGNNIWTRKYKPFKLIYYESFYCKKDALYRERFLKSGIGNKLVKLIKENFE